MVTIPVELKIHVRICTKQTRVYTHLPDGNNIYRLGTHTFCVRKHCKNIFITTVKRAIYIYVCLCLCVCVVLHHVRNQPKKKKIND